MCSLRGRRTKGREGSRDPNDRASRSHPTSPSLPFVRRPRRLVRVSINPLFHFWNNGRQFTRFSPQNSFFKISPFVVKLTIKCLVCSTKCLSFSRHVCQLDAMFVSSRRMTSLFRFIPSILLPRAEYLEYIPCIQNRNSESIERI